MPGIGIPHGSEMVTTHVGAPGPGPPSGRVTPCRELDCEAVGAGLGLALSADLSDGVMGIGDEQPDNAQPTTTNPTARRRGTCVRSTAG
jgi:hypothetical protein